MGSARLPQASAISFKSVPLMFPGSSGALVVIDLVPILQVTISCFLGKRERPMQCVDICAFLSHRHNIIPL